MKIFKIYLDTEEIKNKVNDYLDTWDYEIEFIQNDYILMSTNTIIESVWKKIEMWLRQNNIDFVEWDAY